VLDSVGIGELPDAADYDDMGRSTLGHIAESRPLEIPDLVRLGLAISRRLKTSDAGHAPLGAYGKGAERSPGKDTTTGHWEMAGVWLDAAFPFTRTVSRRNDRGVREADWQKDDRKQAASGTEIIKELGEEHVRTGKPIVYTSGDSVFQIARMRK